MINAEEFTKRLHQIMEHYELSAASFADRIDVGRSSISHLLSGRNKPSLDFVLKIITAFPEVELYWLLNGKGSFPAPIENEINSAAKVQSSPSQKNLFSQEPLGEIKENQNAVERKKQIQRIVIFYKDGSFEAYEA